MARARLISDEEVLSAISKLRDSETTISESNLLKEIGKGSPYTIKKIIKDLLETERLKFSDYEKLGKTIKILNREYFESHKYQIQAKIEEEVYADAQSAAHSRIREEVQNEFEQREKTIRSEYESKLESMQKDNQIRDLEKDLAFANEKVALLKEIIQSTRT
ncbi:Eukaryotic translation initiation factor 3 110 kDa subunit [Vibrio jasicida]|uniref:Eukaryotic translation initiation factor 3 110 kDa subunit n=1 Tax=Vibrio jasicida TaxID=766224 RepID=A0AAU9QXX6_9VIBR|nr:Eukaryotic translation initiation factor 3 110 kDa subunit [Vibrio jasicida]CAH1604007.1 Eukaryotic translation initiation factor 3 110 kDa subunit [Vibrio jasicida]